MPEQIQSDSVVRTIEALHSAAFNTGLGNGLYCDVDVAHHMTADVLRAHLGAGSNAGNIAIVATGVQIGDLVGAADRHFGKLSAGTARSYATKFIAGESRVSAFTAPQTIVALGFNGVGLSSADLAASAVLRHLLGGAASVKYGKGASLLSKAAAASGENTQLDAFNLNYRDAGLFGVLVRASSANVRQATNAAAKAVSSAAGSIAERDVAAAKAAAKFELLSSFDSSSNAVAGVAASVLAGGKFSGAAALAAKIDAVSAADVSKLAKKLIAAKPALAVHGDTAAAPLISEIAF